MRAGLPIALAFCLPLAAVLGEGRPQGAAAQQRMVVVCNLCPVITLECPDMLARPGLPVSFKARVSGAGPDRALTYRWTVSAGTITSGTEGEVTSSKGMAEFTAVVNTTELAGGSSVTATVEVGGFDRSCSTSNSCTTIIVQPIEPRPMDYYGNIRFADEMALLDNFAIELQNSTDFHGYIECYGRRVGQQREAMNRCARAKRYLSNRRGIAPDRIVLVDGGFREELTVGLWLLPPGTNFTPSPTVDPKDVRFTKDTEGTKSRKRAPRQRHITP